MTADIDSVADLLAMVGQHTRESVATLDDLERTYRARLAALPDAPELADLAVDIGIVLGAIEDVRWLRNAAAQALLELAIERARGEDLETRIARLEQRTQAGRRLTPKAAGSHG